MPVIAVMCLLLLFGNYWVVLPPLRKWIVSRCCHSRNKYIGSYLYDCLRTIINFNHIMKEIGLCSHTGIPSHTLAQHIKFPYPLPSSVRKLKFYLKIIWHDLASYRIAYRYIGIAVYRIWRRAHVRMYYSWHFDLGTTDAAQCVGNYVKPQFSWYCINAVIRSRLSGGSDPMSFD